MVLGDFNDDCQQDLLFILDDLSLVVLLGNGDGTFRTGPTQPSGLTPLFVYWTESADFNEDGHADILVATVDRSGNIYSQLLLGHGDGSFDSPSLLPFSSNPPAVADFNHDGHLDLAYAGPTAGDVQVALGQGNGTFSSTAVNLNGFSVQYVAAADLNGDGNVDLVGTSANGETISLLGAGDGAFQLVPAPNARGTFPMLADLNSDGIPDLIVYYPNGFSGQGVYLGVGDGTFSGSPLMLPKVAGPSQTGSVLAMTTDLNGDGRPDLLDVGNSSLTLFAGDGFGDFDALGGPIAGHDGPIQAVTADFNGDGQLDLAILNNNSQDVTILLGISQSPSQPAQCQPDAGFSTPVAYTSSSAPHLVRVVDVDGDGRLDLITATTDGEQTLIFSRGLADGGLGYPQLIPTGPSPSDIELADLNQDGLLDVVVTSPDYTNYHDTVWVTLAAGDGGFLGPESYPVLHAPHSVLVFDYDHDGNADLMLSIRESSQVEWLRGIGDGGFEDAGSWLMDGDPNSLAEADFDHDGAPDWVAADFSAGLLELHMGDLSASPLTTPVSSYPEQAVAADLNRDGWQDVVVAGRGGIDILLNDGAGHLSTPTHYWPTENADVVVVTDLDGDGVPDLLSSSNDQGQGIDIFWGVGDGTFQGPEQIPLVMWVTGFGVGDLDGDGRNDLIYTSTHNVAAVGQQVFVRYGCPTQP
jgi:hypothetical protein